MYVVQDGAVYRTTVPLAVPHSYSSDRIVTPDCTGESYCRVTKQKETQVRQVYNLHPSQTVHRL